MQGRGEPSCRPCAPCLSSMAPGMRRRMAPGGAPLALLHAPASKDHCRSAAARAASLSARPVRPAAPAARRQQGAGGAAPGRAALLLARVGADETKDLSTSAGGAFDYEEPETAKEAIDLGLVLCKQERWDQALAIFQRAMTLPGTGTKRFRDKPRLISDGERMASLFNVACCHARLGQAREGLLALSGAAVGTAFRGRDLHVVLFPFEASSAALTHSTPSSTQAIKQHQHDSRTSKPPPTACLEAGYADFDQILADPDLELLRQDPRFGTLVQRFQPKSGSFMGIKLPW
ncbi:MAG: hypothetical protein J3K34DRAFT_455671 [Monoraphidium minutum]|nr:MAG: hypothetical protein J3K34DRAFT_455671 [Monoraphidium minutum]